VLWHAHAPPPPQSPNATVPDKWDQEGRKEGRKAAAFKLRNWRQFLEMKQNEALFSPSALAVKMQLSRCIRNSNLAFKRLVFLIKVQSGGLVSFSTSVMGLMHAS
jgi:hypothetical protein